jgi:F-type H+-transporting ATPase subunit delta
MENPRIASRYAKSLVDLAVERNCLEETLSDMQLLDSICKQCPEFEVMLKSPVIPGTKKLAVINAVVKNNMHEITNAFMKLLVAKGREEVLANISLAFIEQYNFIKNIKTVSLTTASAINDSMKSSIVDRVAGYLPGVTIDLKSSVDEKLIGGFVLEVGDQLFDASVRRKLNDIKAQVIDTSYVTKI